MQITASADQESGRMPRRRGRAAAANPATRFDPVVIEFDPAELGADELRSIPTLFFEDNSRSILAKNNSPDVPFTYSVNAYRGCEHGCIYCYARPSHEYLGWSAGLDFETRILIKRSAPALLAGAFEASSWQPQVVALSGNTDPYQPVERKLALSRGCLEVCLDYRNPVGVITKNYLVTRDIDILQALAERNLVRVSISITTLRSDLASRLEPRTSNPSRRLDAIEALAEAGVPVGVMVAPVIPGLTDEELPVIISEAARRGARRAGYTILRLPGAVEELFVRWLQTELPERADRILRRLREIRGGSLSDSRFGNRMRGEGIWARALADLFRTACAKAGLNRTMPALSTDQFRRRSDSQLSLF